MSLGPCKQPLPTHRGARYRGRAPYGGIDANGPVITELAEVWVCGCVCLGGGAAVFVGMLKRAAPSALLARCIADCLCSLLLLRSCWCGACTRTPLPPSPRPQRASEIASGAAPRRLLLEPGAPVFAKRGLATPLEARRARQRAPGPARLAHRMRTRHSAACPSTAQPCCLPRLLTPPSAHLPPTHRSWRSRAAPGSTAALRSSACRPPRPPRRRSPQRRSPTRCAGARARAHTLLAPWGPPLVPTRPQLLGAEPRVQWAALTGVVPPAPPPCPACSAEADREARLGLEAGPQAAMDTTVARPLLAPAAAPAAAERDLSEQRGGCLLRASVLHTTFYRN